jgi:hypothetical protein
MLTNRDEPDVRARLDQELARDPSLATVIDVAAEHPARFAIDASVGGLEIMPLDQAKGAANRCRVKLFRPREEKDRMCAFFYKRSNLSFSRDRYSYGAVEFIPGRLARDDVHGWLTWLQSGFDPERRPLRLRRAFPYTVPE